MHSIDGRAIRRADLEAMAQTIFGEARGEPEAGQAAVACVVVNRVNDPRWPGTIHEVCHQPKQFSCWNMGDPNRSMIENATLDDPKFLRAYAIGAEAMTSHDDPSNGANHYMTEGLFYSLKRPSWSDEMRITAHIGRHVFLRG